MGHLATDSLNGRSSFSLPLNHEHIIMADTAETTTPTTEAPVAEKSAEAEAVPEVASNGAAAEKEESTTNGEAVKETKEAETNGSTEVTNGASEEVPASSNGSTTEVEEKKVETSSEAVKRK